MKKTKKSMLSQSVILTVFNLSIISSTAWAMLGSEIKEGKIYRIKTKPSDSFVTKGLNTHKLGSEPSDLCLNSLGTAIGGRSANLQPCLENEKADHRYWSFEKVGNDYRIKNQHSKNCLNNLGKAPGKVSAMMQPCALEYPYDCRLWSFEKEGDAYRIKNQKNGHYLKSSWQGKGAGISMESCLGDSCGSNELWIFEVVDASVIKSNELWILEGEDTSLINLKPTTPEHRICKRDLNLCTEAKNTYKTNLDVCNSERDTCKTTNAENIILNNICKKELDDTIFENKRCGKSNSWNYKSKEICKKDLRVCREELKNQTATCSNQIQQVREEAIQEYQAELFSSSISGAAYGASSEILRDAVREYWNPEYANYAAMIPYIVPPLWIAYENSDPSALLGIVTPFVTKVVFNYVALEQSTNAASAVSVASSACNICVDSFLTGTSLFDCASKAAFGWIGSDLGRKAWGVAKTVANTAKNWIWEPAKPIQLQQEELANGNGFAQAPNQPQPEGFANGNNFHQALNQLQLIKHQDNARDDLDEKSPEALSPIVVDAPKVLSIKSDQPITTTLNNKSETPSTTETNSTAITETSSEKLTPEVELYSLINTDDSFLYEDETESEAHNISSASSEKETKKNTHVHLKNEPGLFGGGKFESMPRPSSNQGKF